MYTYSSTRVSEKSLKPSTVKSKNRLRRLTKKELVSKCRKQNLSTSGNKQDLIDRILAKERKQMLKWKKEEKKHEKSRRKQRKIDQEYDKMKSLHGLTSDVYVIGRNSFEYELGLNHHQNLKKLTKITEWNTEDNKPINVQKINVGFHWITITDIHGNYWIFGKQPYKVTIISPMEIKSKFINTINDNITINKVSNDYRVYMIQTADPRKLLITFSHWIRIYKLTTISADIISVIRIFYGKGGVYEYEFDHKRRNVKTVYNYIDRLQNIRKISSTLSYTLALKYDGSVYCKEESISQRGIYTRYRKKCKWLKINGLNEAIIDIAIVHESAPSTQSDKVFLAKSGILYRMNDEKEDIIAIPYFVKNKILIGKIAGGWNHCLCIDNEGRVYSFGCNKYAQCGHKKQADCINVPKMITFFGHKKANHIGCGRYHSYVRMFSGGYCLFGRNNFNQCSIVKSKDKIIDYLHEINEMVKFITRCTKIVNLSLGNDTTFIIVGQ